MSNLTTAEKQEAMDSFHRCLTQTNSHPFADFLVSEVSPCLDVEADDEEGSKRLGMLAFVEEELERLTGIYDAQDGRAT